MNRDEIRIEEFDGDHRDLERSFRLAEDSDTKLDEYIDSGRVWVAVTEQAEVVGHIHAVASVDGSTWEVVNTAVVEDRQGIGIGRRLLERAVDEAKSSGANRVELATATADIGNLRFYQRCGFRMSRIVRDAFGPHSGDMN
ncbi:GNAT family N-acetyltransferase [Antrihabitans stalactiti]|uniref:GNAT family N-acetyltransferase n=1 Tax=Antrihabitans stalactiti TaxID=2584121 RepID=A0A848KJP1_9NOCA|nr:GNAT family N-acetyltransferase [Antrihabitans stalactiti]NMN97244.1 GNAT family N-acetyltransferase [Antrihabitans stalactiti]